MKFTFNWLKQYVDFDWSPPELADKLTFAGIEVEDVQSLGGKIPEAVVVGQILASEKHPNADKLTVCRVNDGAGERQIVCGAKNYQVGDKVPLALPGATMAAGFTIQVSKLRGIESQGMMCSAEELGLPQGEDGLLILPADAPVGMKFSEYQGGGDTVFDIEVTPNRPDWLSVIGIAREISALTGNPLRMPAVSATESTETAESFASVKVEAPDLCSRYTARVIRGVKVGPSPAWLRQALEKVGLRSINNVVDVTNYVLLEAGHPLHAFDGRLLHGEAGGPAGAAPSKPLLMVRRAVNGEMLTVIDGTRHELTDEMLVIADADRAVALAGIMGGQESEIHEATTDVLLESAWFLPGNIRKTARRLGLSTEASYRFERGTDIEGLVWASNRAAALIQQVAGGQVARGMIDVLARPIGKRQVTCRHAQIQRLLGIEVPADTVKKIFTGLGLTVLEDRAWSRPPANDAINVEVPTFRVDLEREADLIEEVCRIHGVDKVPAAMQPATAQVSESDARWDEIMEVRRILAALGFDEAVNQTLGTAGVLRLQNPLSADQEWLRASLEPGLIGNLRTNVSRHQFDLRLFEVGRVFDARGAEKISLGLVVTGRRSPGEYVEGGDRAAKAGLLDLKGAIEDLFGALRIDGFEVAPAIRAGGREIGVLRRVDARLAKKEGLRDECAVAEIDLDALLSARRRPKQFRELAKFPAVVRDVALLVEERVTHAEILAAFAGHQNKDLERIELFDIFRGDALPAGRKSLAYSLTYRSADRTLTDAEVNAAHARVVRQLQQTLQCEIREG